MATVQLQRDPFARTDFMRESVHGGECAFCGRKRSTMFIYYWRMDGISRRECNRDMRVFCSVGCYRAYN